MFGEVRDEASLATLEAIAMMPFHEATGTGGTIMRLLDRELATAGTIIAGRSDREIEHAEAHGSAMRDDELRPEL